jgi:hypothetical protein
MLVQTDVWTFTNHIKMTASKGLVAGVHGCPYICFFRCGAGPTLHLTGSPPRPGHLFLAVALTEAVVARWDLRLVAVARVVARRVTNSFVRKVTIKPCCMK